MGDRSAHDERVGSRTRLQRLRRWMYVGDGVKRSLGPHRGGGGRAGRAECSFPLSCVLFLFPLLGEHGGKEVGEPWYDSL